MYTYRIVHKDGIESTVNNVFGFYTKEGLLLLTNSTGTVCTMFSICNLIVVEVTDINTQDEE